MSASDAPSPPAAPPRMDYAPRPPLRRRRWVRRLGVCVVLLAAGGSTLWWLPPVWRNVQVLRMQARCASFTAPPDRVVYDRDRARGAQLRAFDPRYATIAGGTAAYVAAEWADFYAVVSPPGARPAATVFLHERRNSRGERRLIAVTAHPGIFANPRGVFLDWYVLRPGTSLTRPKLLHNAESHLALERRDGDLRLFAGQPDPKDVAHFTFDFEQFDYRGTVDGWLRDDDTLVIERRGAHLPLPWERR